MESRCFYAVYGATFCCSVHELEDTQFVKRKLIAGTKELLHIMTWDRTVINLVWVWGSNLILILWETQNVTNLNYSPHCTPKRWRWGPVII